MFEIKIVQKALSVSYLVICGMAWHIFDTGGPYLDGNLKRDCNALKAYTSPVGLEPTASGLEVRRAIHCATGTTRQLES